MHGHGRRPSPDRSSAYALPLRDHTPLRIRGGGSKDFTPLQLQGETCWTPGSWHGIVSYEPSELVVTVRAGTPLAELEAALAAQGQCLAFEPPHFAVGLPPPSAAWWPPAGVARPRASVGAVRDFVLGVEIINGQAEAAALWRHR